MIKRLRRSSDDEEVIRRVTWCAKQGCKVDLGLTGNTRERMRYFK